MNRRVAFTDNLKKWKNLIYIMLAIAILIMICIAATSTRNLVTDAADHSDDDDDDGVHGHQQASSKVPGQKRRPDDWWKADKLLLNQTAGILYGCPSLNVGRLWTFEAAAAAADSTLDENQIKLPSPSSMSLSVDQLSVIDEFLTVLNVTGLIFVSKDQVEKFSDHLVPMYSRGVEFGILVDLDTGNLSHTIETVSAALSLATNDTVRPKFVRFKSTKGQNNFKHLTKTANRYGMTVVMWNSELSFDDAATKSEVSAAKLGPANGGVVRLNNVRGVVASQGRLEKLKHDLEQLDGTTDIKVLTMAECFM